MPYKEPPKPVIGRTEADEGGWRSSAKSREVSSSPPPPHLESNSSSAPLDDCRLLLLPESISQTPARSDASAAD
jgi:hypothetical protein